MNTELRERSDHAKAKRAERGVISQKLQDAITGADASSIIELEKRAADIETEIFAADLRVLEAKIDETEARKIEANAERTELEASLKRANAVYALTLELADNARQKMQGIQAQLFGKDNEIESAREDINAIRDELKKLVATRSRGNN